MSEATPRRTGWTLFELAADASKLAPHELAVRHSSAFLLRQTGGEGGSGQTTITQTLTGVRAIRAEPLRGLLDYQVFPLRRAGAGRFGGDYIGVGRGENNDIIVEGGSVSKFHAFVVQDADGFAVSDAGSKNGTFVNDVRVGGYRDSKPSRLKEGDKVRLGDVALTFMSVEAVWRLVQRAAVAGAG
jgi:hypothetical protein